MSSGVIPCRESVQLILTQLLGPNVTVSDAIVDPLDNGIVAVYVSEQSDPLALCIADTGMTVFAGSAFLNIPPNDSHAMLITGEIQPNVFQSYEEVANILTRVLTDDAHQHLRLDKVHAPASLSESDYALDSFSNKVSFHVEIPSYGTGELTFHVR